MFRQKHTWLLHVPLDPSIRHRPTYTVSIHTKDQDLSNTSKFPKCSFQSLTPTGGKPPSWSLWCDMRLLLHVFEIYINEIIQWIGVSVGYELGDGITVHGECLCLTLMEKAKQSSKIHHASLHIPSLTLQGINEQSTSDDLFRTSSSSRILCCIMVFPPLLVLQVMVHSDLLRVGQTCPWWLSLVPFNFQIVLGEVGLKCSNIRLCCCFLYP